MYWIQSLVLNVTTSFTSRLLIIVTYDVVDLILLLRVVLKGFADCSVTCPLTPHHRLKAAFTQTRWHCTLSADDELTSCVPAPPVLSLSESTGSEPAGYRLASCPGLVSVEEEGRRRGWSNIALWRAGFASLFPWQRLSYSIQPWDGLCIYKQFPVVFQALLLFSFSCTLFFSFFFYCLFVFKSNSTLSSLAAVLDIEHHLHLNQAWILPLIPV